MRDKRSDDGWFLEAISLAIVVAAIVYAILSNIGANLTWLSH